MFRNFVVVLALLALTGLIKPAISLASEVTDSVPTCTSVTQYGGSVSYICGASTHVPVNTGLGENLALIGALTLLSSGFLLFLSHRAKTIIY